MHALSDSHCLKVNVTVMMLSPFRLRTMVKGGCRRLYGQKKHATAWYINTCSLRYDFSFCWIVKIIGQYIFSLVFHARLKCNHVNTNMSCVLVMWYRGKICDIVAKSCVCYSDAQFLFADIRKKTKRQAGSHNTTTTKQQRWLVLGVLTARHSHLTQCILPIWIRIGLHFSSNR